MIREAYASATRAALAQWSGRRARWGVDDCGLALADINLAVQGVDPLAFIRGTYSDQAGAIRVLARYGGLAGLWGVAARRCGWKRIPTRDIPQAKDGDRGVARTSSGTTTVIRYGGRWVARAEFGDQSVTDKNVLRAWSVC